MKVKELIKALDSLAPLSLQENYDNAGLALGNPEREVGACLVCLDVTPEVIGEAKAHGIPMVISHHPVIFKDLKRISENDPTGFLIIEAIRNDIVLCSMHTNLDNVTNGVNHALALKIGMVNLEILRPMAGHLRKLVTFCPAAYAEKVRDAIFTAGAGVIGNYDCCSFSTAGQGSFRASDRAIPFVGEINQLHFEEEVRIETIVPDYLEKEVIKAMIAAHPYEEVAYDLYPLLNNHPGTGAGMKGELTDAMEEREFIAHLKRVLGIPQVRHSGLTGKKISRVAICGGAGGFLLNDAISSKADAFVTADLRYHQFFDARSRILMIDAGHFETEQFTTALIAHYLNEIFPNFAVHISKVTTNPVNYL
jgi:dinuclear metal center YbgI/SA1388 family protein